MNQQPKQNAGDRAGKSRDQSSLSKPSFAASSFAKSDPRETAQEAVHQVTPRKTLKAPYMAKPLADEKNPPPRAARGDDDVMSKQQTQAMPSADQIKGKWKQQVGAAKIAWGKLTEDELLESEGQEQKLAGLVQERYAVTRDEADRQIKSFFADHKSGA